ncbi:MAG TPA: double-strand break repair protein AddB [Pseudolabrys sp.]|nr:double-strand break repair protein AddB [Pseudolabrys sp.]
MSTTMPRVFNIPASVPFLPALIAAARDGRLVPGFPVSRDPLELARATLYLPTRRACRVARDAFLTALNGEATILPRIIALGDIDEDEIIFAEAATAELAEDALAIAPAIKPLERRLLLSQLIVSWAETIRPERGVPLIANTPAAAFALADDLGRLIDDVITRKMDWQRLDGLVPDKFDKYWQLTLEFLKIARTYWPERLTEQGKVDAAARRDLLIEAEMRRLAGSNAPVIAAGSTGSMPATAKLLSAIAQLPHGAVVLPGLDRDLDEESWRKIASNDDEKSASAIVHPQFAIQALLTRMGITRDAVEDLLDPAAHGRDMLVSEALRPAATTDRWQARFKAKEFAAAADEAMSGVGVIETANAEEEALAIAVCLREAAEAPNKSAALVTPDRALARRVVAALERWQVDVEDSGGDALADTSAGVFARLVAEAALGGLEPASLLALLKHPLLRLGGEAGAHARAVAALERAVLRGPRPRRGLAGLAHALATFKATRDELHRNDPRNFVPAGDFETAERLADKLTQALVPLEALGHSRSNLFTLAQAHAMALEALSDDGRTIAAYGGVYGRQLQRIFETLAESEASRTLELVATEYPDVFHLLCSGRAERRAEDGKPRVRIFGLLEARLQSADRIVLAGLNEGTWPPETRSDPWLSRPMRLELGLNLPELRVGLSAHDFAQGLGAPEVFLTRAARQAGAPTVSSRFLQRLAAVAGEERWKGALKRGATYAEYARALDHPAKVSPMPRPQPVPPPEARPSQLSVTDIENWLRDPYTIYAKHVLRLLPLEAIDTPPGATDRGTFIHEAIGEFTKTFADTLPPDVVRELTALGKKHFASLEDYEEARAFWWTRFRRIANWFERWESGRRAGATKIFAEISGKHSIPLGNANFLLTARADRIEHRADGSYAILDYKTGQPPTEPQVRSGLAPQLTLEAAILRKGGFPDIPASSVSEIGYVRLKGGEPPIEPKNIRITEGTPDSCADIALQKLTGIAQKFLVEGEPYRSLVHPMWKKHYGDYDHLARVKEWAASGGESEYEP